MNTSLGYAKRTLTDTNVLLSGGGDKPLSDFIGSISWDATNKKIKYTPVGGSATDLVTFGSLAFLSSLDSYSLYEAYLLWGGKNFSGSYGPIDAAMVPELGACRTMFLQAPGIVIEYSTNAGATWIDYGATNAEKVALFSTGHSFTIGKATTSTASANNMLRVTMRTGVGGVYTTLNKFVIHVTTYGSSGTYCTIRCRTLSNYENGVDTWITRADHVPISGWSGYNVINILDTTTYGNDKSSQYGEWQFIFGCTGHSDFSYAGLTINKIFGFGGMGHSTPSTMAMTGHLYSFDSSQNATFPAKITATSIIKSGGTAALFLKADGSVDTNLYLPLSGGTMTGVINWGTGSTREILQFSTNTTWKSGLRYSLSDSTTVSLWGKHKNTAFVWNAGTDAEINGHGSTNYDFRIRRESDIVVARIAGNIVYHEGNLTKVSQLTNDSGYVTSSGVTSITLKAGTGISLDVNNTAITSTGTRTITNSGVRATTINGNYLRVNTNGTNADLTIPYATNASNADKLATVQTIWGQSFDGSSDVNGNIYIDTSDNDRFIQFRYNTNNYAGASWRLLSRGSGIGNANYFDIETGGSNSESNTWNRVIRLTMDDRYVGIGTDSPTLKLHVAGNGRFNGGIGSEGTNGNVTGAYIVHPEGGTYATSTSSVTGYLKITLPHKGKNCMMSFDVTIFTYDGDNHSYVTYHISGYEYGTNGWHDPVTKVYSEGTGNYTNLTVRLGNDGTYACVTIGEANTVWSFPQVTVHNIMTGYSNCDIDNWIGGWSIGFTTTALTTVVSTKTNVNTQNINILGSASNADTLNGNPASAFATSGHNHEILNLTNFSNRVYDATVSRIKNTVLAAPNGSNGAASFRALVAADIPTLTMSKISDAPSTKSFTVNGTTYSVYTSSTSLPTILAPTSYGTANYILATNANGNGLTWVAKPTSNVSTAAYVSSSSTGKTQITATQSDPYYNLVEGSTINRSILFKAGTGMSISSTTAGVITFTNSAASALNTVNTDQTTILNFDILQLPVFDDDGNFTGWRDSKISIESVDCAYSSDLMLVQPQNPTSLTTYYPIWSSAIDYDYNNLYGNDGFKYSTSEGVANTVGLSILILGNSIVKTAAKNKQGLLRIYSESSGYGTIILDSTTNGLTHTLPTTGGTILNTGTTSFTRNLSSGTKIGSIKINGTSTDIYCSNTTYKFTIGSTTYGDTTNGTNLGSLSSYTATSGGTTLSLVTTGEKYTWNSKTSNTGTVTSVTLTSGTGITVSNSGTAITTSGSRTISLASGVVTAGTAGTSSATEGSSIDIPYITVDTYGRVTGYGTHTHTVTGSGGSGSYYKTTLNNTTYGSSSGTSLGSWYAPTSGGTSGQVLKSMGSTSTPEWKDPGSFITELYVPRVTETANNTPNLNRFRIKEHAYGGSSGNIYDLPSNHFYHIYTTVGNDSSYATELAISMSTSDPSLFVRNKYASVWNPWVRLLDADPISMAGSYLLNKSDLFTTANFYPGNRIYGLPGANITINAGSGSSSTIYSSTSLGTADSKKLMTMGDSIFYFANKTPSSTTTVAKYDGLLIIIDVGDFTSINSLLYGTIRAIYVYGANCEHVCTLTIDTQAGNSSTWNNIVTSELKGWSGTNIYWVNPTILVGGYSGQTTHIRKIRIRSYVSTVTAANNKDIPRISGLGFIGDRPYLAPSNIAINNHLYTINLDMTGVFPSYVQSTGFKVTGKDDTYVLLAGGGTTALSSIGGGSGGSITTTSTSFNSSTTLKILFYTSPTNGGSISKVYYNTNFYVNNSGVYYSSDRNLKINIKDYSTFIKDNPIKLFDWKDGTGRDNIGFIAQEVEEWCPQAVGTNEDGGKTVNYKTALSALCSFLYNKIKDLEDKLNKLEKEKA